MPRYLLHLLLLLSGSPPFSLSSSYPRDPVSSPLDFLGPWIVAAVYCNGPREERAIRGQGKGQKEGQQTVGETFIFTRSPRARLRWYNSCLRDYLFSLKRLPVGGFSRQAIGPQGRKPCLKVAPPYRCLTHGPSSCTLIMRICLSVRTCWE